MEKLKKLVPRYLLYYPKAEVSGSSAPYILWQSQEHSPDIVSKSEDFLRLSLSPDCSLARRMISAERSLYFQGKQRKASRDCRQEK